MMMMMMMIVPSYECCFWSLVVLQYSGKKMLMMMLMERMWMVLNGHFGAGQECLMCYMCLCVLSTDFRTYHVVLPEACIPSWMQPEDCWRFRGNTSNSDTRWQMVARRRRRTTWAPSQLYGGTTFAKDSLSLAPRTPPTSALLPCLGSGN